MLNAAIDRPEGGEEPDPGIVPPLQDLLALLVGRLLEPGHEGRDGVVLVVQRVAQQEQVPFLEGRKPGTTWKDTAASPLLIDNRTVLHLLRSLQYLELHGEARRLSFRALDIEQIGHVYEGLLDHTVKRATEPVLSLTAAKGDEPEVALSELERLQAKGEAELLKFLKE